MRRSGHCQAAQADGAEEQSRHETRAAPILEAIDSLDAVSGISLHSDSLQRERTFGLIEAYRERVFVSRGCTRKCEQVFAAKEWLCYNEAGTGVPTGRDREGSPVTDELTERQREILDFIKREIRTRGYPPSVREIGEAIGLSSSSTVHGHLARLEEKGLIRRDPTKPRAIEVHDHDSAVPYFGRVINVPVVGRVTAGQPILAVENIEETFPLPVEFARDDSTFLLIVRGESMIEAGIFDGDYVLVRQQQSAENGDIVVALIEDEATVKRFFKENGHFRLQPENRYMEAIIVPDVTVLGKVIGLFRRM